MSLECITIFIYQNQLGVLCVSFHSRATNSFFIYYDRYFQYQLVSVRSAFSVIGRFIPTAPVDAIIESADLNFLAAVLMSQIDLIGNVLQIASKNICQEIWTSYGASVLIDPYRSQVGTFGD